MFMNQIDIGIYKTDCSHSQKLEIHAQAADGDSIGNFWDALPIDARGYVDFGYNLMEKIMETHEGLEKVVIHPGNFLGIGPAEPIRDSFNLNPITAGMMGYGSQKGIEIPVEISDRLIDLEG